LGIRYWKIPSQSKPRPNYRARYSTLVAGLGGADLVIWNERQRCADVEDFGDGADGVKTELKKDIQLTQALVITTAITQDYESIGRQ
jgi:hypothetical protein